MGAVGDALAAAGADRVVGHDLAGMTNDNRQAQIVTWTVSPISRQGTESLLVSTSTAQSACTL